MAELNFTNRAELIDLMVDTLNRLGSVVVKDRCSSWIKLHEARANRVLRDRNMVVRATATLSEGMIRLPNDFKEAIQVQINDGNLLKPRPLSLVTQEEADRIRASGRLTEPAHYAIVGRYLEVVPYTAASLQIELAYYKAVPALTNEPATNSNWLLAEHPDYYFYGSLVHSAPYLRDDERIVIWGQLAQAAQDEMLIAAERSRFSGSRLKTRARLRN